MAQIVEGSRRNSDPAEEIEEELDLLEEDMAELEEQVSLRTSLTVAFALLILTHARLQLCA